MTAMDRKPGSEERGGGPGGGRGEEERKTESELEDGSVVPFVEGEGRARPDGGSRKHEEGRRVEGEATK